MGPIDEVVRKIKEQRPKVLFAPHVETSTGMILPDDYIKKATEAMHEVGGLFVLDCIASGMIWADTKETSFSMSLKRWSGIMNAYEQGGFGYHTTMPTDALRDFHEISVETMKYGMPECKQGQQSLGDASRSLLESKGLTSVAAPGFEAPGVLVYYSPLGVDNPVMMNKFKTHGLQIAMGVPWQIGEPEGLKTFRLGLFGLDKISNITETIDDLEKSLDNVLEDVGHSTATKEVA